MCFIKVFVTTDMTSNRNTSVHPTLCLSLVGVIMQCDFQLSFGGGRFRISVATSLFPNLHIVTCSNFQDYHFITISTASNLQVALVVS